MSLDALSPSHWHPVDWSIVGPALVAGLLVLSTHVPLGQRVLRKGIVFIDLAIAQIAGLGVIAAGTLGWSEQVWAVQGAAVGAALLGAVLLTWMERRWPDIQEALIGALFVLASSVGILLLAGNPHGGEHLKDLLVGQILWVTPDQLWGVAALSAAVLAVSAVRELLGSGTLDGVRVLPERFSAGAMTLPVGGFLVLGCLAAGLQRIRSKSEKGKVNRP